MRLANANLPSQYRGLGWDSLDPYEGGVESLARMWADGVVDGKFIDRSGEPTTGKGLLLHGDPGHGKTHLAAVVLQDILQRSTPRTWGESWDRPYQPSRPAYMTYYRRIPITLQRQMNNASTPEDDEVILDMSGARFLGTALRLLVLDDVGKEHRTSSGWAAGFFEGLIRDRYYQGFPTVMTTNISPQGWADAYGDSTASFLTEAFIDLKVTSPVGDRRKASR